MRHSTPVSIAECDGGTGSQKRSNEANGEIGENKKYCLFRFLRLLRFSVFKIRYLRPLSRGCALAQAFTVHGLNALSSSNPSIANATDGKWRLMMRFIEFSSTQSIPSLV
jgi:hypothetical protein